MVSLLFFTTVFTVIIINTHLFGIILAVLFIVILSALLALLYKKPRFIIYPDKLIFTEHGFIKPKELYWKDCTLYPAFHKNTANGQEIPLLHFLYKNNNGEMERFSWLGLKHIRFNEHHFDKDDTLKFFENIKSLSEKL